MSIILLKRVFKRRIKLFAVIREITLFGFLSLILTPALARADEWGCADIEICLENLEDKDPYVRMCAAVDIRHYGQEKENEQKKVIAALKRHLQDTDNRVRYRAAGSLAYIDTTSKEALPIQLEMIKDEQEAEIAVLSREWHGMLNDGRIIIDVLPVEQVGKAVLSSSGDLFDGNVECLRKALETGKLHFHTGRIRGAFPSFK